MSFILHDDSWGWDWRFSTVWSKAARSPCCWLSTLSVDYAMALYPFIVVPLSLTVSGLGSPKPLHISEMWGESCSGFLGKEKRLFLLSFSFSFFPFSPFQHERPIPWIQLAAFLSRWGWPLEGRANTGQRRKEQNWETVTEPWPDYFWGWTSCLLAESGNDVCCFQAWPMQFPCPLSYLAVWLNAQAPVEDPAGAVRQGSTTPGPQTC